MNNLLPGSDKGTLMVEAGYPLRARVLRSALGKKLIGPLVTRRGIGLLIGILSAISIGVATPFARLAFDAGVDVVALMAIRYGLAIPAVVLYLAIGRQPWRLHGRQLGSVLGLALALGFVSLAFFASIRRIPVSLAALIYYTYPIIVSVLAYRAIGSQEKHRASQSSFRGQAISFAGLLLVLGLSWVSLDGPGVLLAASSAMLIALVYLFGDQLMQSVPPMVLNLYVALINAIVFVGISVATKSSLMPINLTGWIGLFGAVVLFVAGFMGMFAAVRLLGSSQAACLKNLEPVITVAMAIILLGESYGIVQLFGVGLVLVGILTGCNFFWRPVSVLATNPDSANDEGVEFADCTPLCRMDSRCLLT